jgi:predicted DNA-binding ArsR family transcriptional regulator
LFNIQQEQDDQGNNEPNCQKIVILESGRDTTDEGGKEKIEFVMRSGIRISVNLTSSHSKAERIIVTIDDDDAFHPKENSIEMEVQPDTVSLTTQRDLRIKAKNIEIEADETIRLKSGSTMTINGSLIKIN